MRSIFLQYFKYGNVFIYLLEDGSIITLPVHLIRVANVMIGGEPVLEFNCKSVRDDMRQQGMKAQKDFLEDEDLKVRLEGFPPEVADALNKGADWVQLNPENTFVLQDVKEDWMRYAVPMVATCLNAFKRKALIAQYESALLNLGAHSFVHVTYGDSNSNFKTSYDVKIRKGDIVIREDGCIFMLNWQVQDMPNNQTTQAIVCNATLSFTRHVDETVDDRGFLVEEAHEETIVPPIPCVFSEYAGRPDYAANYNTPGISADHLLTVQVQWNDRTKLLRTSDEFELLHSRYRIVDLVGTELDITQQHGILNLMARKVAGEDTP